MRKRKRPKTCKPRRDYRLVVPEVVPRCPLCKGKLWRITRRPFKDEHEYRDPLGRFTGRLLAEIRGVCRSCNEPVLVQQIELK